MNLAKTYRDLGADSICIKDMAGLLLPQPAYDLVKAIKEETFQSKCSSHYTSGVASMTYMKAIEAGADIIDTDMSQLSMGLTQPQSYSCCFKGD